MQVREGSGLADVQMDTPSVPLAVNQAGIKGYKKLARVPDREAGSQATMADISLAVNLPATLKGTHMSRLVKILEDFEDVLSKNSVAALLAHTRNALCASAAYACFSFTFLARKKSPASGLSASIPCPCSISASLDASGLSIIEQITTPVMTVCPCSLAISGIGAHSQRADARLKMGIDELGWIEEFIEISEQSSSSAVYSLLKREDEKLVTEKAFSRPMFVEDVARGVSQRLGENPHVLWFNVEIESHESIHGHNAFASISMDKRSR